MICEECFAGKHDGHQVRILKNYHSEKLEKRLGGLKLHHSLVHPKKLEVNLIQSNTSKLQEAKLQVTVTEKQLNSAIELKTAIASHLKHLKQVSRKIENFEKSGHLKIPFAEKSLKEYTFHRRGMIQI